MSRKKMLKYLSMIGVAGGALLAVSFFLDMVAVSINDAGYHASGLDLALWRMRSDYLAGASGYDIFVPLHHGHEIFFLVFVTGLASIPLSVFRDTYLRGPGALCGIGGVMFALIGYVQFTDAAPPDYVVGIGYGLALAILAGSMVFASNVIAVYLMVRKKKRKEGNNDL